MIDDTRSRKPAEPGQIIGACLHVAATSTALLTSRVEGEDLASPDLSFVANTVRQSVVVALQQAARHVDRFAEITAQDIRQRLTTEQEVAKAEAVRALGRELEALAQRSAHQTIAFAEFEDIRVRLTDLGLALMPHHALDVAAAIMDPDP